MDKNTHYHNTIPKELSLSIMNNKSKIEEDSGVRFAWLMQCRYCKAMGVTWNYKLWLINPKDTNTVNCPICGHEGQWRDFKQDYRSRMNECIEVPDGTLLVYNETRLYN